MSLRARLAAAFALVTLLPLLVLAVVIVSVLPTRAAEAELLRVQGVRDVAAQDLVSTCRRLRALTRTTADAVRSGEDVARAVTALVRGDLVDQVVVVTEDGEPVAVAPPDATVPDPTADCLVDATSPSDVVLSSGTVTLPDGALTLSLGERVDAEDLAAWGSTSGDVALTVIAGGEVVASTLDAAAATDFAQIAPQVPADGAEVDGTLVAVTRPQPGLPQVVASGSSPEGLGMLRTGLVGGVLLGVPLLAGLLGWSLAGAVTRPLSSLVATAREVEQGRLDARVEVLGDDEVGRLGEAFAAMRDRLRQQVEELRRNSEELRQGLTRLGATLSGSHDLDRIADVVLETAVEALRARAGAVLLVGEDGRLRTVSSRGIDEMGGDPDLDVAVGEGRVGVVAARGRALLLPIAEGAPPPPADGEPDDGTAVFAPLLAGGDVVGVLALHGRRDAGRFGEDDLAVLRTFAGQAATAVVNVRLHVEAQRLSLTDELTGLHNYRYLAAALSREVERSVRFTRPLAVLLLDLDLFKAVNDTYGHQRGDRVLRELADRLRQELREVDTVARYGGEEMVVVLPETGDSGGRQTAERLRSAVSRRPFGIAGEQPVTVTVSIGIALFPQHSETAEGLLAAADSALYAAKSAGRDTWRVARDPGR